MFNRILYAIIAFVLSLIFSIISGKVFIKGWKDFHWLQKLHNILYTFSGCLFGYLALYYIIRKGKYYLDNMGKENSVTITLVDFLIFFVAISGIMGQLGSIISRIAGSIEKVVSLLFNKLSKV